MEVGRPKLTRKEAIAVLGDYPDADLHGFDVEGRRMLMPLPQKP